MVAYLGFKFDIENQTNLKINSKKINTKFICILIETQKIKENKILIIGKEQFLKQEDCEFFYLDKNLKINEFVFFENPKIIYSKIAVNDKKIIDYQYNTIWLNPKTYKEVYQEYLILDDEQIDENKLKIKVNNIYNSIN